MQVRNYITANRAQRAKDKAKAIAEAKAKGLASAKAGTTPASAPLPPRHASAQHL